MTVNPHYTSIIITYFSSNELRRRLFHTSLESLISTSQHYPLEIIVVDNSVNPEETRWLGELVDAGKINCLIKNSANMNFGFARNQAFASAFGNYVCIADDDVYYGDGWLEACWKPLDLYPDMKIYATPIDYPTCKLKEKYHRGKLKVGTLEYDLSMRAGSNCYVMRRKDFEILGGFACHRLAGSKWVDKAVHMGYVAAVAPGKLVSDMGLRQGFDFHVYQPICRKLTNGEEIYFNQDEYSIKYPDKQYYYGQ